MLLIRRELLVQRSATHQRAVAVGDGGCRNRGHMPQSLATLHNAGAANSKLVVCRCRSSVLSQD